MTTSSLKPGTTASLGRETPQPCDWARRSLSSCLQAPPDYCCDKLRNKQKYIKKTGFLLWKLLLSSFSHLLESKQIMNLKNLHVTPAWHCSSITAGHRGWRNTQLHLPIVLRRGKQKPWTSTNSILKKKKEGRKEESARKTKVTEQR